MSLDILMAVYNGSKFLEEQLDSVLGQSCGEFRLIICDDCSDDGSRGIIEKYAALHPDKITVIYNSKNIGAKESFFKLLSASDADHIMFCDQDDIWQKDKVRLTAECMRASENGLPTLVHTDLSVIDENGDEISPSMLKMQKIDANRTDLNELLVQNIVTGCTAMINRPLAALVKKPACPTLHDWWLALTACLFGQIVFLPETTIRYRRHSKNIRGAKNMADPAYILSRMLDPADAKAMLKLGYIQAAELAAAYGDALPAEQAEMLFAYGKCTELGKADRILTARKYKIWKQGAVRRIGQLLYM